MKWRKAFLSNIYIICIFPATLLSEVTGPCGLCSTACRAPHMQTSHRSPRAERHAGFSVYTWPEIFCLSKNQASQWHFKTEQSHSAVNQVSSLPPLPEIFHRSLSVMSRSSIIVLTLFIYTYNSSVYVALIRSYYWIRTCQVGSLTLLIWRSSKWV